MSTEFIDLEEENKKEEVERQQAERKSLRENNVMQEFLELRS